MKILGLCIVVEIISIGTIVGEVIMRTFLICLTTDLGPGAVCCCSSWGFSILLVTMLALALGQCFVDPPESSVYY